ncbi:hypothetical protein [Adhaeribacter arboris]|uniref:hypothetical protein n=1 Tax=Adhaeribacter arboris TaxID=2072846 RepID=UPI0018EC665A|nr:hypothetical protein [Adhaeribacter arboris]
MNQKITYEPATHNSKEVIFIRFDYSRELNERVRKLVGVHWSRSQKAWYVLNTPHYR